MPADSTSEHLSTAWDTYHPSFAVRCSMCRATICLLNDLKSAAAIATQYVLDTIDLDIVAQDHAKQR